MAVHEEGEGQGAEGDTPVPRLCHDRGSLACLDAWPPRLAHHVVEYLLITRERGEAGSDLGRYYVGVPLARELTPLGSGPDEEQARIERPTS
eukprot:scaffold167698_cov31-Tisochrysis_lutea.AAC.3